MAAVASNRQIIPGPSARASFARAISDLSVGDEVAVSTHGGLEIGTITKFYGRAGVQIRRAAVNHGVERQKVYLQVDQIRYIEPLADHRARFAEYAQATTRDEIMDQFDAREDEVYADPTLSDSQKREHLAALRRLRDERLSEVR